MRGGTVQPATILDEIQPDADPSVFTTTVGVKLRLRRVSGLIVTDAVQKIEIPKPPKLYIEEKDRWEENPNDPDYLEKRQQIEYRRAMLGISVYATLGTDVVEVPAVLERPEDTEWSTILIEVAGLDIPVSGRSRYLAWLKYYILTESELTRLINAVMRYSGVTLETDVQEAVESFRSD